MVGQRCIVPFRTVSFFPFKNVSYLEPRKSSFPFTFTGDGVRYVEQLVLNGANVNALMERNVTALHLACRNAHEKSVKVLLKHGADRKIKTADGKTALELTQADKTNPKARERITNWLQMCYKI